MRINEYNSGRHPSTETQGRKFMGIEFLYRGVYCRMCYEPPENEGKVIGCYEKLNDLLNNCLIGGVPFKDVIMDDNTEILSQD